MGCIGIKNRAKLARLKANESFNLKYNSIVSRITEKNEKKSKVIKNILNKTKQEIEERKV